MDTPAEVKPIATSPSLRSHRKSTSKRYGRRRLRSRRDMVCRYTHSEPPSAPKSPSNTLSLVDSATSRRKSAAISASRLAAWMPSSRFGSRIAPNRSSGFNAISVGFSSRAKSICAASARVTVSSVGRAPMRALRSSHELTAAKRLRLPSMLRAHSTAENGREESHAKK